MPQPMSNEGSRTILTKLSADAFGPAGKSTLLGLIAGVRIIQEGKVIVFGGDMANKAYRTSQIGRIAYMPQGLGRNLYPTLSVFENIDFHGRLFGQSYDERQRHMERTA